VRIIINVNNTWDYNYDLSLVSVSLSKGDVMEVTYNITCILCSIDAINEAKIIN